MTDLDSLDRAIADAFDALHAAHIEVCYTPNTPDAYDAKHRAWSMALDKATRLAVLCAQARGTAVADTRLALAKAYTHEARAEVAHYEAVRTLGVGWTDEEARRCLAAGEDAWRAREARVDAGAAFLAAGREVLAARALLGGSWQHAGAWQPARTPLS